MKSLLFILFSISVYPSANAKCEGILVTGGQNEQAYYQDTLEFYSPFWRKSAILAVKLLKPRESHATIALSSSKILIAGGETADARAVPDTELIDLHTGSVVRGPPMSFSRRKPGFVIFKENVWLCGGDDEGQLDINSCETYHDGSWSPAPTMLRKRWAPAMAVYRDALYVMAGYDSGTKLESVEKITSEASQWQEVAPMKTKRYRLAAQVLGDFIYACGGVDDHGYHMDGCEKYHPDLDQWKDVHGKMKQARSNFPMISMHGMLYSLGGLNRENGHDESLKSIERYNASSDSWDTVGDLVHGRSYSTGALLSNC